MQNKLMDYAFIRAWREKMNRDTDRAVTFHVAYPRSAATLETEITSTTSAKVLKSENISSREVIRIQQEHGISRSCKYSLHPEEIPKVKAFKGKCGRSVFFFQDEDLDILD